MHYFPRIATGVIPFLLLAFGVACGGGSKPAATPAPTTSISPPAATSEFFDMEKATTTASGLKYIDTVVGTGEPPKATQSVVVNYTGKLASNGQVFDSTSGRGPATFPLSRVIPGFSEGILTMLPGGKRTIYIPAALAYGANPPQGSGIPANADLIFDIELISVQ
jgi:FKBP-type peptidyl-prolyl cis-trans isomerase